MLKIKRILFTVFLILLLVFTAHGETAEDVTKNIEFISENISLSRITDNSISTHSSGDNVKISGTSQVPLEGIYIKFNTTPSEGLININETISENGFLHEYIPLNGAYTFELFYPKTDICDIQVFSKGNLPNTVQVWQTGENETDILLCATHSDDDQLFFAGLLPLYAGEKGLRVRVAYFINHYDTYNRTHELLDGLWHCGVTLYPDISPFPDGYSESIEGAKSFLENKGFTYDDILEFQRKLLNKYRPLVAVLHDFNGEYGHGAHMLNTASFIEVCENAKEGQYIPEKIYVHLYNENTLTLDIDTPLDCFGGKSAFNVSQDAFAFHKSQHWTWFYKWIYGTNGSTTSSAQIKSYNPAKFGLYYSAVGADVLCNDIIENVTTYDERAEIAKKEEQKRLDDQVDTTINCSESNKNQGHENDEPEVIPDKSTEINTSYTLPIIIAMAVVISAFVIIIAGTKRKG